MDLLEENNINHGDKHDKKERKIVEEEEAPTIMKVAPEDRQKLRNVVQDMKRLGNRRFFPTHQQVLAVTRIGLKTRAAYFLAGTHDLECECCHSGTTDGESCFF